MVAGVVLAGGRSVRMGRPKATLEWHGSTLVRRARALLEHARVNWLCEPGPESLDDPAAYEAARARPAPQVVVDGRTGRAATLGGALGDRLEPGLDPELPLVDGDAVQTTRSEPV